MSHTWELSPPSIGATSLYWPVAASKTATFATSSTTAPSRSFTSEKLPPIQMLSPVWVIVRTVPSTMRVLSGVSEGDARALPCWVSKAKIATAAMSALWHRSTNFSPYHPPFDPAEAGRRFTHLTIHLEYSGQSASSIVVVALLENMP